MKILLCAGTRPNFVKIAPLYHQCKKQGIEVRILHTGQHYDFNLNQIFFDQLGIPTPDINLDIEKSSGEEYIKAISNSVSEYLQENPVDFVVTVGDVNSTVGCTLGAKKVNFPVVHVESGLRSHDMRMPEEVNRIKVDKMADIKFVSEPDGVINLVNEGLYSKDTCFLVGNVVIDNLLNNLDNIERAELPADLIYEPKTYALATLHRPSNVDEKIRLREILKILNTASKQLPIVMPLHPRTKASIEEFGYEDLIKDIKVVEPLGPFQYLHLLKNTKFVVTDSGGTQEESTHLRVPCITMRANTERPITIISGSSVLAGEDTGLLQYYLRLGIEGRLRKGERYKLWDGRASERILKILSSIYLT